MSEGRSCLPSQARGMQDGPPRLPVGGQRPCRGSTTRVHAVAHVTFAARLLAGRSAQDGVRGAQLSEGQALAKGQ